MNKVEIRKTLLDINKTMGWLAIQLKISRRTLYRKLENDDLKTLKEIKKVLSHYI